MSGFVELRVRENGKDVLVYNFKSIAGAAEMMHFLSDMMPGVSYVVQPLRH
jgi:hypothetical protein